MLSHIEVRGAREHNLKGVDVRIPRDTLTVITGLSGSGKSSLLGAVLDTAETLGRAADRAGLATPFVAGATTLRVAAQPGREPHDALVRQVYAGLAATQPAWRSRCSSRPWRIWRAPIWTGASRPLRRAR